MIGAMIGAQIAVDIKEEIFNRILAVVIVLVGLFLVFHKDRSKNFNLERLTGKYLWLSITAFFFIGIYRSTTNYIFNVSFQKVFFFGRRKGCIFSGAVSLCRV